jgi:ferredoxin--NADP+ reductase
MSTFDQSRPLRVAVIGSGPSGLFLAEALLKTSGVPLTIDVIERLPTPYGLVRYGVAPDHGKIKSVIETFKKIFADERVRFLGNVRFGTDLTLADAQRFYDVIAYAVGASADRSLNIPGEELAGSLSATEFVAWYSGHPDHANRTDIALEASAVAVVGVGNVAIDVARILAKHVDELKATDIPAQVLEVLAASNVRDIYLIGRRGPAQAKFTTKELRELGELLHADVVVLPADLELDPASAATLEKQPALKRNFDVLQEFAARPSSGRARRLHLRFLASPVRLTGDDAVAGIVLERNRIDESENAVGTGVHEEIPVQLVLRAVGYRGLPVPGIPFDPKKHVIPNAAGRVLGEAGAQLPGQYVTGWIKRGPTGVIGTNKADSSETARGIVEDIPTLPQAPEGSREAVDEFLAQRGVRPVSWEHWLEIDRHEIALGQKDGRDRAKLTEFAAILEAQAERAGVS